MNWSEIRQTFPEQWIVVEALNAHTDSLGNRVINDFSVIEQCSDGTVAFNKYRELHKNNKSKEYYYLHTSREKLVIEERLWVGIRIDNANPASI
jgi:hypothetical protein